MENHEGLDPRTDLTAGPGTPRPPVLAGDRAHGSAPTAAPSTLHGSGVAAMATTDVGAHRERSRAPGSSGWRSSSAPSPYCSSSGTFSTRGGPPRSPLPSLPAAHAAGHRPDHRAGPRHGGAAAGRRAVAPRPLPARRADDELRRRAGLRGPGRGGDQDPQPLPGPPDLRRADGRAPRARPSCSRAPRARARPTWPRPWPPRPACPSSSSPRRPSSRCSTARPTARSAPTSRPCARYARREGGAIGFIEEIDAIGGARGNGQRQGEGIAGVVNELLIQLQSFEQTPLVPPRQRDGSSTSSTRGCPPTAGCASRRHVPANILVIGATNRASDLDPALLRPAASTGTSTSACPAGPAGGRSSTTTWARRPTSAELDEPADAGDAGRHDRRLLAGDDRAPAWTSRWSGRCAGGPTASRGTTSTTPR